MDVARERTGFLRLTDACVAGLFVLGVAAPVVRALLGPLSSTAEREERVAAEKPELAPTLEALRAYPPAFEAWYGDHFGLRPELIRLHNHLLYRVFASSPTDEMVRGRGDWIFTTNSRSLPVWRGRDPFSEGELAAWTEVLGDRAAWCRDLGALYVFAIAPNKSSIYPERMPWRLQPMGRTRMDQLVAHLETRSQARVLDLRPALRAAREHFGEELIYYPLGTHWNKRGGAVAVNEILAHAAREVPGVAPWPIEEWSFTTTERQGDSWARRMYLEDVLFQENVDWVFPREPRAREPRAREVALAGGGRRDRATEVADPELATAVVFHDSFGQPLQPLFAEHFRRAVQYRLSDFLPAAVLRERPDVVIHLMTERGLVALRPIESPFDTPERLEAEIAAGTLLAQPGRGELEAVGDLVVAAPADPEALCELRVRGPDAGCLLPPLAARDVPPGHWPVVVIDLEAPSATRLWLQLQTERERDYTRIGRAVWRDLQPGPNRVRAVLRVPDLAGRLLLRPGAAGGAYVVRRLEVYAVPRRPAGD